MIKEWINKYMGSLFKVMGIRNELIHRLYNFKIKIQRYF